MFIYCVFTSLFWFGFFFFKQKTAYEMRISDWSSDVCSSDLTGHATVDKRRGRTRLDGAVAFGTLDFEDLASDAGNAAALALERSEGLRLVPNTRINLAHVGPTDGRIAFAARRIVSRRRDRKSTRLNPVTNAQLERP